MVGKALAAGEDLPEDYDAVDYLDDGDEDEEEADSNYRSALDDINLLAAFKTTVNRAYV